MSYDTGGERTLDSIEDTADQIYGIDRLNILLHAFVAAFPSSVGALAAQHFSESFTSTDALMLFGILWGASVLTKIASEWLRKRQLMAAKKKGYEDGRVDGLLNGHSESFFRSNISFDIGRLLDAACFDFAPRHNIPRGESKWEI